MKWFGLLFLSVSIWAQSVAELEQQKQLLKKEISKVDAKITASDSLQSLEKERYLVLVKRYQNGFLTKDKELSSLQQKMKSLNSSISTEISKQKSIELKGKNVEYQRQQRIKQLTSICSDLEKQIEASLPWDKEKRLDRARVLRRDLESGNANLEEGFSRLQALFAEAIQFGDEVVISTKSITRRNGEVVNAKTLRLGDQWMVYVDDDEKKYGLLQRSVGKYSWKEELEFSEREAVRKAIAVKLSKKAPQIVELPLSLDLSEKE